MFNGGSGVLVVQGEVIDPFKDGPEQSKPASIAEVHVVGKKLTRGEPWRRNGADDQLLGLFGQKGIVRMLMYEHDCYSKDGIERLFSFSFQNHGYGHEHDLEVQLERPVVQVKKIVA